MNGPTADEARRREATRDLIEELERKYFLREQRLLLKQCSNNLKKKLYAKHHAQHD